MGLCEDSLPSGPVLDYGYGRLTATAADRDLATRLRSHAETHSDSKDLLLEAAAMLGPLYEES